jgi:bacterioferritin-associated ferredoxin
MYVCICNAVTDKEIRQAVRLGATTMRDLRDGLGVAANCGKCTSCAKGLLREELACQPRHCADRFSAQPA